MAEFQVCKTYLFTFGLARGQCECLPKRIADAGPQQRLCHPEPEKLLRPQGSFWFKELPSEMSHRTKLTS